MNRLENFDTYQQFHMHFSYENRLFVRYCAVPISWQFEDVENYLKRIFSEKSFKILKYRQKIVYLFNEKEATRQKSDEYNIGFYWRDGIEWELEILVDKKQLEIIIVTDTSISEKDLFKKIQEFYPKVNNISTFYQTECWIKNIRLN